MENTKKTLSKVWILNDSKPESERNYYFYCWFDPTMGFVKEFQAATTHCKTNEVVCNHKPEGDAAIIVGRGRFAYRNKDNVECVRSYFLEHGWKEVKV